MKFKLKKLIALGLTLAMTCSALSMPAYALNVVDNPEVSTDGTNSVDSSTFETVEITTDENGNTVIGTDETESETTTPTEGGEETTPPTTEGGEETTTPPTTEGGEETTIPPTTEGGETTTPPTTDGGETTTPPEVVDPGFGVDPVDPGFNVDQEVPTTEGGETEVPEVPETPEFIPEEVVGLDELISVMSIMPMADETVSVDFVDAKGNLITTEDVQMGYIDDIIGNYQTLEHEGHHYRLIEPKVIGSDDSEDDVEFIGKYVDPVTNGEYIYYSTDGISAILISHGGTSYGYRLVFKYQEYFRINYSFESSLGTLTGPTEINEGEDLVITAKPTRGNATRSIKAGEYSVIDVKLDYGEYTIPAINITSDITVSAEFDKRIEPYTVTITNPDIVNINNDNYNKIVDVDGNHKWYPLGKESDYFYKQGEKLTSIIINGSVIDLSGIESGWSWSDTYQYKNINGLDTETVVKIQHRMFGFGLGYTQYQYRFIIENVYNDLDVTFVTQNTSLFLTYLYVSQLSNATMYYIKEGDTGLEPVKYGSKIDARNNNEKFYFYFKPDIGYEFNNLYNKYGDKYLVLSDVQDIKPEYPGYDEAVSLGLTKVFTLEKGSNAGSWSGNLDFGLNCSAINYKVSYTEISGVTDSNTYNIGQQIKLPSPPTEPDVEGKIFAGWKIDGVDYIYPGGSNFALNETTCLLAKNNEFVFEAQFVDEKYAYKIQHWFENDDGTYDMKEELVGTVSQAEEASKIAIAMPLKNMPAGYEDYEYDPTIPGSKITADLNVETNVVLSVYYRAPRRLIYSYQENGVKKNVTDGVRYSKGETAILWTAPVSTKAGSEDLYFAGWEHDGNIYKAKDTYTFPDKPEKAVFTAVYYSTEVENGGEVDTTLFGNLTVDYNADKTNACVYGTTNITKEELANYSAIGFVISSYNNAPTTVGGFKATVDDTVYGKIKVNGAYNEPNPDGYYFGVNFNLCNNQTFKEFTATPYVTLNNGTIIYGAPVDINFN